MKIGYTGNAIRSIPESTKPNRNISTTLGGGTYDPIRIEELFVDSKGANIKYDYEGRRRKEANTFNR